MTIKKKLIAIALAAPAALAFAAPAQAQVTGSIATVDQFRAIVASKAFGASRQQITATFKTQIDQINAREQAAQQELQPLRVALDTNKDGQVSDAEIEAAQKANNPNIAKIQTARQNAARDIARLQQPIVMAQAYSAELILQQYEGAQNRVIQAKKVGVILSPNSLLYAPPASDITDSVTAELDKALPTAPITPPANWQPSEQTVQFLQAVEQIAEANRARAAQQQAQAPRPAGAAPAATAPAPRPATPQQQPQSR